MALEPLEIQVQVQDEASAAFAAMHAQIARIDEMLRTGRPVALDEASRAAGGLTEQARVAALSVDQLQREMLESAAAAGTAATAYRAAGLAATQSFSGAAAAAIGQVSGEFTNAAGAAIGLRTAFGGVALSAAELAKNGQGVAAQFTGAAAAAIGLQRSASAAGTAVTGAAGGVTALSGAVGGLVAAAGGYITVRQLFEAIGTADAAYETARAFGFATDRLIGLQRTAEQFGAHAQDLTQAFRGLSQSVGDALRDPGSAVAERFRDIGIEVETLRGQGLDTVLLRVSDGLRTVTDDAARTEAAVDLLRVRNANLLSFLLAGSEEINRQSRALTENSGNLNTGAEAADRFGDAMARVKNTLADLALQSAPNLAVLAEGFEKLITKANEFNEALQDNKLLLAAFDPGEAFRKTIAEARGANVTRPPADDRAAEDQARRARLEALPEPTRRRVEEERDRGTEEFEKGLGLAPGAEALPGLGAITRREEVQEFERLLENKLVSEAEKSLDLAVKGNAVSAEELAVRTRLLELKKQQHDAEIDRLARERLESENAPRLELPPWPDWQRASRLPPQEPNPFTSPPPGRLELPQDLHLTRDRRGEVTSTQVGEFQTDREREEARRQSEAGLRASESKEAASALDELREAVGELGTAALLTDSALDDAVAGLLSFVDRLIAALEELSREGTGAEAAGGEAVGLFEKLARQTGREVASNLEPLLGEGEGEARATFTPFELPQEERAQAVDLSRSTIAGLADALGEETEGLSEQPAPVTIVRRDIREIGAEVATTGAAGLAAEPEPPVALARKTVQAIGEEVTTPARAARAEQAAETRGIVEQIRETAAPARPRPGEPGAGPQPFPVPSPPVPPAGAAPETRAALEQIRVAVAPPPVPAPPAPAPEARAAIVERLRGAAAPAGGAGGIAPEPERPPGPVVRPPAPLLPGPAPAVRPEGVERLREALRPPVTAPAPAPAPEVERLRAAVQRPPTAAAAGLEVPGVPREIEPIVEPRLRAAVERPAAAELPELERLREVVERPETPGTPRIAGATPPTPMAAGLPPPPEVPGTTRERLRGVQRPALEPEVERVRGAVERPALARPAAPTPAVPELPVVERLRASVREAPAPREAGPGPTPTPPSRPAQLAERVPGPERPRVPAPEPTPERPRVPTAPPAAPSAERPPAPRVTEEELRRRVTERTERLPAAEQIRARVQAEAVPPRELPERLELPEPAPARPAPPPRAPAAEVVRRETSRVSAEELRSSIETKRLTDETTATRRATESLVRETRTTDLRETRATERRERIDVTSPLRAPEAPGRALPPAAEQVRLPLAQRPPAELPALLRPPPALLRPPPGSAELQPRFEAAGRPSRPPAELRVLSGPEFLRESAPALTRGAAGLPRGAQAAALPPPPAELEGRGPVRGALEAIGRGARAGIEAAGETVARVADIPGVRPVARAVAAPFRAIGRLFAGDEEAPIGRVAGEALQGPQTAAQAGGALGAIGGAISSVLKVVNTVAPIFSIAQSIGGLFTGPQQERRAEFRQELSRQTQEGGPLLQAIREQGSIVTQIRQRDFDPARGFSPARSFTLTDKGATRGLDENAIFDRLELEDEGRRLRGAHPLERASSLARVRTEQERERRGSIRAERPAGEVHIHAVDAPSFTDLMSSEKGREARRYVTEFFGGEP